jgi:hypothetical protein
MKNLGRQMGRGFFVFGFGVGGPSAFRTLPGTTYFSLSCQRKVSKERRARDGERFLEFA